MCFVLGQAFSQYKSYMGAFDKTVPEEFEDAITTLTRQAHVTKCSNACLQQLLTTKPKDTLRLKIQSELQALRRHGVKEGEVLHPLLMSKIQLALTLRYNF